MDSRLNYHTSITGNTIQKSEVNKIYGDRIKYYISLKGGVVGEPWFHTMENLKKLNKQLDENNIVSLAYMATNPYISDEDREKYEKQMKEKGILEYEMYKKFFDVLRTS
jgi:hypothetical protein